MKLPLFKQRIRLRVGPAAGHPGEFQAVLVGAFGRALDKSPVGKLHEVEEYVNNYVRFKTWQKL